MIQQLHQWRERFELLLTLFSQIVPPLLLWDWQEDIADKLVYSSGPLTWIMQLCKIGSSFPPSGIIYGL